MECICIRDANGFPEIGWNSDRNSAVGAAAVLSGLCCPLVPYGFLMAVLMVAYFAFRSAGS